MSYRILRQVARGGFSEVFEIEDPASAIPELLILKRLNREMSVLPQVRTAFSEEAKILRELKHPNVVTFRRCYFDEAQRVCLVMEKVVGEPLDAWARRHAARPDEVLDLFERVLAAVDYLHHRAVPFLHLDLKPDNILIAATAEGPQPVLIDFGIARRSGGGGLKAYTPPYGAPEQESGGALDSATDVFALGRILAEILEPLCSAAPERDLSLLVAVAEKASRRARRERFADAGEMRLAYRRARMAPAPSRPAGKAWNLEVPSLESFQWRRRRTLLAIGSGIVLVFLAGFFLMTGGGGEPGMAASGEGEPAAESPAEPSEDRRRFSELQYSFEEALIEGSAEAPGLYRQARDLSDSVPADSETWRWMKKELDTMSAHLSQAESGGWAGEEVRMLLRQKHLTYRGPQAGGTP